MKFQNKTRKSGGLGREWRPGPARSCRPGLGAGARTFTCRAMATSGQLRFNPEVDFCPGCGALLPRSLAVLVVLVVVLVLNIV